MRWTLPTKPRTPPVTHRPRGPRVARPLRAARPSLRRRPPRLRVAPVEVGRVLRNRLFAQRTVALTSATLALGAERGWSAAERELLLQQGFLFVHLGERVLRTETACIAAITLLKAKLGLA